MKPTHYVRVDLSKRANHGRYKDQLRLVEFGEGMDAPDRATIAVIGPKDKAPQGAVQIKTGPRWLV